MLVLTRYYGQSIYLNTQDGLIEMKLLEVGRQTKIGFEAPRSVNIVRAELQPETPPPNHTPPEVYALRATVADLVGAIKAHKEACGDNYATEDAMLWEHIAEFEGPEECQRDDCNWVDARNKVVASGELCTTCNRIRAGNHDAS